MTPTTAKTGGSAEFDCLCDFTRRALFLPKRDIDKAPAKERTAAAKNKRK